MRATLALLADRGVVRVEGADAGKLLQGLVTNDLPLPASPRAVFAALLTPQGKILFDFFVTKRCDGFLLETDRRQAASLAKRLSFYRLRAQVSITDESDDWAVFVSRVGATPKLPWESEVVDERDDLVLPPQGTDLLRRYADPRIANLGERWLTPKNTKDVLAKHLLDVDAADYHAHRIALGVPEGGKDYAFGDTFPHEANFDLLNGVSFGKGCFVGQEVVSRMQHRGLARKRIVIVDSDEPLASGGEITAGSSMIGTIGSVAGNRALAQVRLDRAEEARAKGETLTVAGRPVRMRLPGYFTATAPADAP